MANRASMNLAVIQKVEDILHNQQLELLSIVLPLLRMRGNRSRRHMRTIRAAFSRLNRIPAQVRYFNRLVNVSDVACIDNLRMDRNTFGRLCILLRGTGDLVDGNFVSVEEQVAMFLGILAHHKKNRIVRFQFTRSGYTVSRYVHAVLGAVLKLHDTLLVTPEPVSDEYDDSRWKWFKGCLGALDGTYINMHVPNEDKPRYRSRKGQICTNTLAVCDRKMRFVYVLCGWEGSAGDARVLRDAVTREHGLKVPRGNYYLCDNGYANSDGFLTPYKGVRYHLKEWGVGTQAPQNAREIFNMRHTKARNVIERAFAVLKMRWGILRSASYYPSKIQIRLMIACFLLHNFIRSEMENDPMEIDLDNATPIDVGQGEGHATEFVDIVEPSPAWTNMRDTLAESMWNGYGINLAP
ncbi:protein ANTAGONIST OF LIKE HETEROCHROMATIN PROTEIN 1-like [Salvia splendens]|uniref:protein ANTAGONIST OF LIKE HETEROCHROMATIN PROTEIN 1-like n=1 Tax=Salvia splendens TaxID=180675 RepID=UPI001C26038C|nr:protein ANTAGONIST OF LIKE HETEROCHROMATIN PROTEIN 1-like [Salvia splendens]